MRSYLVVLILLLQISFAQNVHAVSYEFNYLTNADGLSHNTINDMVQDSEGYIWIATVEGLNKYNSSEIVSYYADATDASLPSNEITALVATPDSKIFIGTNKGACYFDLKKETFKRIVFSTPDVSHINDVILTSQNKVLFATNKGIISLDNETVSNETLFSPQEVLGLTETPNRHIWGYLRFNVFEFFLDGSLIKNYNVTPNDKTTNLTSPISCISINQAGELLVGTFKKGALKFNGQGFSDIITSGMNRTEFNFIRDINQDQRGNYWLATESGLFIYEQSQQKLLHFVQSFSAQDKTINDNAVYKILQSRENIIWLGTYFGGINYINPEGSKFKNVLPANQKNKLQGKAISEMISGPNNQLWIATEDAGIAIFDHDTKLFSHITADSINRKSLSSNNVHALMVDTHGTIWSGNFLGGINKLDANGKVLKTFLANPYDSTSIDNDFVFELFQYNSRQLLVGTTNGVDLFDIETERFSRFRPDVFRGNFIYSIFSYNNRLWFASYNNGLYCLDLQTQKTEHFNTENSTLPGNSVISHLIDSQNKLWIGTRDGGLARFNSENKSFDCFNMNNGLPNNCIYGIQEDNSHNLWLSTNKGISKLNIDSKLVTTYTMEQGLLTNQFNFKSSFKDRKGNIYFGSVNGFCYFNPDEITSNAAEPSIHFSAFKLSNIKIEPGAKSVLHQNIDYTDKIVLKHNQNGFTFEFFTIDYFSNKSSVFYYKMEGFDQNWNAVGKQNSATYTNIPPGDYTFNVRTSPEGDSGKGQVRTIHLHIQKPFYQTIFAYSIYILVFMLATFLVIRGFLTRQTEKVALRMEKLEKEKVKEIHEHKMNFFTYISHEFKTPLTIILASLDEFIELTSLSIQHKSSIESIKRNANRLLTLINQLMEFRKIESDHVSVHLQTQDVVSFLREILNSYIPLLSQRKINYAFYSNVDHASIAFDFDKLEKIVTNLLINAVKNTSKYGSVALRVNVTLQQLEVSIEDTGKGLTEEQIKNIFEIHYSHDESDTLVQGSGIGLALTRSLVSLLNGSIDVKSKPLEGSVFKIMFAISRIEKNSIQLENESIYTPLIEAELKETDEPSELAATRFELYLVEDNPDLVTFLKNHFKRKYVIHTFENGKLAWEKMQKSPPDVVITDVMMPEMDGITLCRNIKEHFETNHIPVIMLTAKSDVADKLKGLDEGADYYIGKPFVVKELELYIENILENRNNLKLHIQKMGNLNYSVDIKNKKLQFVERLTEIIYENIDNENLDVDFLTTSLKISRSLLHTKIKQTFDLSTTEFINITRLNQAKKMLLEKPNLSIAEVAYAHGYRDPNYFTRMFKKHFNTTPKEFREKQD